MSKSGKGLNGKKVVNDAAARSRANIERYKKYKVLIAIPSGDMVHADFAMSLSALSNHTTSVHVRIALNNTKTAEIAHSRNMMVAAAEEVKATHIVFIDSDMMFPSITVQRMLDVMIDTEKGDGQSLPPVKILGCTVPKRRYPYQQVAKGLDGERLKISMESEVGVAEIKEIGTGLLMINMECFKSLKQPYFSPYYKEKNGKCDLLSRVSEDLSLIEKFRDQGEKIFCDYQLSQQCAHIGQSKFDYTSEDFFADAIYIRQQRAEEIIQRTMKEQMEEQMEKKKGDGKAK
jgi:hypothetical protein